MNLLEYDDIWAAVFRKRYVLHSPPLAKTNECVGKNSIYTELIETESVKLLKFIFTYICVVMK